MLASCKTHPSWSVLVGSGGLTCGFLSRTCPRRDRTAVTDRRKASNDRKSRFGQRRGHTPDNVSLTRAHGPVSDVEDGASRAPDKGLLPRRQAEPRRPGPPVLETRRTRTRRRPVPVAARPDLVLVPRHPPSRPHLDPPTAAGIDTKVVSERLGHATIAITANLYTHVIPRLEREAATKLGDALRPQPREAVAYEMSTRDPEQVLEGGREEARSPSTKKAPDRVSAGQRPNPSLSQRARPEGLEPPTF